MAVEEIKIAHSSGIELRLPWEEAIFRRDGTARLHLGGGVVGLKDFAGRVEEADFVQLAEILETQGFFELEEMYGEPDFNAASTSTSATRDGLSKQVTDVGGAGPANLQTIQRAIGSLREKADWQAERPV